MSSTGASKHYEDLLAEVYSWMSGDFEERVNQTREFFIKHNIKPSIKNSSAADLGSGHGIQSAALASLGFTVTAIDQSNYLLNELKILTGGNVNIINGDISIYKYSEINPEVIICMGDTLTHLNSKEEVCTLIINAYNGLIKGGRFVLSYRELDNELTGTGRFIHVKSDDYRILTCFLEYFDEYVMVTDILYTRENEKWNLKTGSYPKLRLEREFIFNSLKNAGFSINFSEQINGMLHIISEK